LVTLLGPVAAESDGIALRLGGPKQRAVFALLALNANRVVSLDRLVNELWSDEPPAGGTLVLQSYVSRLRRLLAGAAASDGVVPQIHTRPPGWVLTVPACDVDVTRFVASLTEARRLLATGGPRDVEEGVALLQAGLALWTGDALSDLTSLHFAREEAARLDELRLAAGEMLLEAMLLSGRHDAVAEQARRFVTTSPFRERGWCALMVALYRSGRQTEALAAGAELRRILADELGLDPSPQVVEIEQRILVQDPALLISGATTAWLVAGVPKVSDAGAEPVGASAQPLVGRADALGVIDAAMTNAADGRGGVLLFQAPAGFGKSTILQVVAGRAALGGSVVRAGGLGPGPMPALWPWVAIARQLETLHPGALPPGFALDSALDRTSLYRAVIDLLAEAHSRRPLTVLIDDAQWIDDDSLTLLALAVDELTGAGVLFGVAVRSDEPDAADLTAVLSRIRRELIVPVPLPALEPAEVAELVSALAGVEAETGMSDAIHSRTAGSPLFVSELIRLLSSERTLTAARVADALPEEIREVLRRRLQRLPEQTLTLLHVAAVAGAATDVELLAAVTGLEPEAVLDSCDPALVAGLLREDGERFDGFTLSHDLVRQTLAESMSTARRTRMHAKIASALQARPDPSSRQIADIAHHLSVAAPVVGAPAAVPYLIAASEDALTRFANEQAERHLRDALELVSGVSDDEERGQLERRLRGRLAALLAYTRGTLPESPGADGLSVPVMTDAESAAAWLGTTVMTAIRGHYALAVTTAEQALAGGVPPVGALAAHYVVGWANYVRGRIEGAELGFANMERVIAASPDTDVAGVLSVAGVSGAGHAALAAHIVGDDAKADARIRLAEARAAGSEISLINFELCACWLAGMRGAPAEAQLHAAGCAEMAGRLQYPLYSMHAALVGGWADAMRGDAAGAAHADAAYADYVATGIRMYLPLYLLLRAEAHVANGDPARAANLVREARAVSVDTGDVCLSPRLREFAETVVTSAG
jgi:DNA-binding SARP family transcriptional activator